MIALGKEEMERIGMLDADDVTDGVVIHNAKTYPAYFGTYDRFCIVQEYLDGFENVFLIGANGIAQVQQSRPLRC